MADTNLLLHLGSESTSAATSTYKHYLDSAFDLGAKCVYHYRAIRNATKDIESHLAMCLFSIAENAQPSPIDLTRMESASQSSIAPTNTIPSRPISNSPPAAYDPATMLKLNDSAKVQGVDTKPSFSIKAREGSPPSAGMPYGSGEAQTLVSWTDDDIDATDYKNMPDYDPDQEDSTYDTTPDPESADKEASEKGLSFEKQAHSQRYLKLHSSENCFSKEDSANYLLLLFIPDPIKSPTASIISTSQQTIPHEHERFLSRLSRYPYLTSHDHYIRCTGYVLAASGGSATTQYLIVQEFSDLERRASRKVSMNWELKRKEAKHWWRKDVEEASGIRVGFFELVKKTDLGQADAVDQNVTFTRASPTREAVLEEDFGVAVISD